MVICSQLPDNENTSVTNMVEYLAAEVIREHNLPTPLVWIEHYPEHEGEIGEYSVVKFSDWQQVEACLGGVWRCRIGSPHWSTLDSDKVEALLSGRSLSSELASGETLSTCPRSASRSGCNRTRGDSPLK